MGYIAAAATNQSFRKCIVWDSLHLTSHDYMQTGIELKAGNSGFPLYTKGENGQFHVTNLWHPTNF